jgi:hypothetical protein
MPSSLEQYAVGLQATPLGGHFFAAGQHSCPGGTAGFGGRRVGKPSALPGPRQRSGAPFWGKTGLFG